MVDLNIEKTWWTRGYRYLLGIDEVGRGSLAGPVVVGGVVIDDQTKLVEGVDDSKKVSANRRMDLRNKIKSSAVQAEVGAASAEEIDELGIVEAINLSIVRMIEKINQADGILLDGRFSEEFKNSLHLPIRDYTKGDEKSYTIAAASIIAKVHRDELMVDLSKKYSEYDWENNKGYGTEKHRQAIKEQGVSKVHRQSFVTGLK